MLKEASLKVQTLIYKIDKEKKLSKEDRYIFI